MARSSLKQHALEYYKKAPVASWILGITTGIIIAAIVALDLLLPSLSFFIFPFLIIPILFSTTLQFISIKNNQQVTMLSSLRGFGLYFRRDFFGSFSYLGALLKAIFTFLITEIVISSIASFAFMSFIPDFNETVLSFYELLQSEELEIETINSIFSADGGIMFIYFCVVFFPSMCLAIVYFVYNISRSSIMIYYRLHVRGGNSRLIRYIYNDARRRNMGRMIKDYLSLNWPLYLLLALGFGGGAVGGYFWKYNLTTMFACAVMGAAFLVSFFFPFYFNNQQAFYDYYVNEFKISTENVSQMLLNNLQANINFSQEEKERLEKTLSDVRNPVDDDENDEENK